ncbi:hypothetical protein FSP39_001069, partial [Pinctada imbricata]
FMFNFFIFQEWLAHCGKGDLLVSLKKHWKTFVLCVYGNNHDPTKEERLAQKFLFRPMEYFLCNGDPDTVFKQLKDLDSPSAICGRVFKTGEPTYSCRDCANDPTCVLCIDCFQRSAHKKHRYRMSTSGGGGYCDCGDTEAWTSHPFCDAHRPNQGDTSEESNIIEALPDDLTDRASALFMATLKYAVEMLVWDQCDSLPHDLHPDGELHDTYVTMLFNDEVHTYEQVISTLQRAVDCSHKKAIEYATTVDREGRSCVREGTFSNCEKARHVIEHSTSRHGSKPLKVQVMHTIVVAHQSFALKMISWLQGIISKSDGLRRLFCLLSTQPQEDGQSLMEKLLLKDTQLWKVARVQSHQLLMAGVLMDQECKKQFAVLFTKHYGRVMHDFARDDHDHEVCVASLTVQIFTVPSLHYAMLVKDFVQDDHYRPVSITSHSVQIFTVGTLARMLVMEHDLLNIIMTAFLEACEEKKNNEGKLAFDRSEKSPTFKRACFMLYDLKYALICKPSPEDWCEKLRENFLRGLKSFLHLLKMMQGMDSVIRQTGMHLEYEPEWEGAFNLQLKQDDVIAEFLEWCGTDREVLIEAYKITLELLLQCKDKPATVKREDKTVHGQKARCLKYDVSTQPVSIHLPLSRFLAGLYVYMEKFGLSFNCDALQSQAVDPVELMEPPLRVQVMIAQTQAGMWRRNGYALLNQIFFYHNVKCRREMFDKDIVMLQICAAVIDSNEFLIHLLNKFNLLSWVKVEYDTPSGQDDLVRQTITLAEEFLNLLIILIGERYVPGIGQVSNQDVVKREIIHQLCISPMAHSELSKGLPEDSNHETGIESVINEVAEFRKPVSSTSASVGKFELSTDKYKEFNPFFYHYSRSEQSKAEEAQLKRKKEETPPNQALPPPVPPLFTSLFHPIVNLLQSDIMLVIMHLILQRSVAARSRSWSEAQLDRVLHLIGLALHEQKTAVMSGNPTFDFISKAVRGDRNLVVLLESLVSDHNNISHDSTKDLLTWVLKLFVEVRKMTNASSSMETLDQISMATKQESEKAKKKKARLAAKRREKIMAQISNMQKNFIKDNAELFESTDSETNLVHASSDMDVSEEQSIEFPVSVGRHKNPSISFGITKATCILCQEQQDVTTAGRCMVLAGFVQRSTVMSQCRSRVMTDGENHDPLLSPADLNTGVFTSSCGHTMHSDCWQRFFDAILAKERRRPIRIRATLSYNIDQLEFLCPLCESLSNTVIPLVPPIHSIVGEREKKEGDVSFNDWLDGLHKTVQNSIKEREKEAKSKESGEDDSFVFTPSSISSITRMMAGNVAKNFHLLWHYVYDDARGGHFSESVRDMLRKFAKDVYSVSNMSTTLISAKFVRLPEIVSQALKMAKFGLGVLADDANQRVPIMAWNTCTYTIQNIEQLLRLENKPLFGVLPARTLDCINALVKFAAVSGQITPVDVMKKHCLRLLSALFPEGHGKQRDPLSILDIDMFSLLTSLSMCLPSLYLESQSSTFSSLPFGGLKEKHVIHLTMAIHVLQIMLSWDYFSDSGYMEVEHEEDASRLLKIYVSVRQKAGLDNSRLPSPWQLAHYIKEACLPFLRCSTILYHHLTGVPVPPSFYETIVTDIDPYCRYLAIPTELSKLFIGQGEVMDTLFDLRLSDKLLSQGYVCDRLTSSLRKFYGRYGELVIHYDVPLSRMVDDILS